MEQEEEKQHTFLSMYQAKLNFANTAINSLPIDENPDNTIRSVRGFNYSKVNPTTIENPRIGSLSQSSLELICLKKEQILSSEQNKKEFAELLSGNKLFQGSIPISHNYCGHQFGVFAGQLGDGRAITLGDVKNERGELWELQLKGSGQTPYSRFADGRAVLRSSIREYLCSEALHFLSTKHLYFLNRFNIGIPTSRAASLIVSDTKVQRDPVYSGRVIWEKCAVVMRVAPTFFRFGSFEIFKEKDPYSGSEGPSVGLKSQMMPKMLDFVIQNYFPEILSKYQTSNQQEQYFEFFKEVTSRTARLVALWQCYGYCHGVLNTDNMSILGLTIDYGPYAFMEHYNPEFICNYSDQDGRYSFENQPKMVKWNLKKLAEALDPIVDHTQSLEYIDKYYDQLYSSFYLGIMAQKLGFITDKDQGKRELKDEEFYCIQTIFDVMKQNGSDFTNTFRTLSMITKNEKITDQDQQIIDLLLTLSAPTEALKVQKKPKYSAGMLVKLKQILDTQPEILRAFGMEPEEVRREIKQSEEGALKVQMLTTEDRLNESRQAWEKWVLAYKKALQHHKELDDERATSMNKINPKFILRNYLMEEAIKQADMNDDFTQVDKLLELALDPFNDNSQLCSFPNISNEMGQLQMSDLFDGVILLEALHQMDGQIWSKEDITYSRGKYCKQNFSQIIQGLNKFYKKMGCQTLDCFTRKDLINPEATRFSTSDGILQILQLTLGVAVQCDNKEFLISEIMTKLDESIQTELMRIIQQILQKYAPSYQYNPSDFENPSNQSNSQSFTDLQGTIDKLEEDRKKFLRTISEIEQENQLLKDQLLQVTKEKLELETSKQNVSNDSPLQRLGQQELQELEIKIKKIQEMESELELRKQKLYVIEKNFDKLKKESEQDKTKLQEELDIEREQILFLRKNEITTQDLKKKVQHMKEIQEKCQNQERQIKNFEDQVHQLQSEISQKKNLEDSIKFLKEEINKEKSKFTQVELLIQARNHEIQDFQSEIKVWKKKDELNQQKINELQIEIEESRIQDTSLVMSSGSLQGSIVQDLENRMTYLQQENEILKLNNQNSISQKMIELEQKINEETRQKQMFQAQLEVSQQRCRKLENECESLKLDLQSVQFNESPRLNESRTLKDERDAAIERLTLANQKLLEFEQLQQQVISLNRMKDEQIQEIKQLYQEKNNLNEDLFKIKEESNQAKNQLQEKQIKEQYSDMEKKLLEQQLNQHKEREKQLEKLVQENQSQSSFNVDMETFKMKMEKEKLKLENEMIQLQVTMKQREETLKENEKTLDAKIEEAKKEQQRQVKDQQQKYEQEIYKLKGTVCELNEEVKNERQLRFEIEKASDQQQELTNSLIVNLGMEFMTMKRQNQQISSGGNFQHPLMPQQQQNKGPGQNMSSSNVANNGTMNFIQKKRNSTYTTFQS